MNKFTKKKILTLYSNMLTHNFDWNNGTYLITIPFNRSDQSVIITSLKWYCGNKNINTVGTHC